MKKYVGREEVPREKVKYPSEKNPRLHLTAEDPGIQELAMSIQKRGLLVKPSLALRPDGLYEAIDGDRRLTAVFDILHWTSIEADIWEVDEKEADRMRLISNVDREELSSWEKGSYLWMFITREMNEEAKTPVEDYWNRREIRGEYIRRLASDLAKSPSFVRGHLSIFLSTPKEYRDYIARSRLEARLEEKISPRVASDLVGVGRKLGNIKGAFDFYFKPKPKKDLKASSFSVIRRAIADGQIVNVQQLQDFYENEINNWQEVEFLVKKETVETAAKMASKCRKRMSAVFEASIFVASSHPKELEKTLRMM